MKLFRNFKTKRQLRKEMAILEAMKPQIHIIERDVEPVRSCILLEQDMPVEYAKEMIARQLADHLQNFIDYDVEDSRIGKKLTGTLYLAKRR